MQCTCLYVMLIECSFAWLGVEASLGSGALLYGG